MISWIKRRWTELRYGHSIYLGFAFSFFNFILITYRLLVEQVPFLETVFPNLTLYFIVALLTYIPLSIFVGHFHRTRQLKTDITLSQEQDPYLKVILESLKRIEKKIAEADTVRIEKK